MSDKTINLFFFSRLINNSTKRAKFNICRVSKMWLHILLHFQKNTSAQPGNPNLGERLSTVDLLIKTACLVK